MNDMNFAGNPTATQSKYHRSMEGSVDASLGRASSGMRRRAQKPGGASPKLQERELKSILTKKQYSSQSPMKMQS